MKTFEEFVNTVEEEAETTTENIPADKPDVALGTGEVKKRKADEEE